MILLSYHTYTPYVRYSTSILKPPELVLPLLNSLDYSLPEFLHTWWIINMKIWERKRERERVAWSHLPLRYVTSSQVTSSSLTPPLPSCPRKPSLRYHYNYHYHYRYHQDQDYRIPPPIGTLWCIVAVPFHPIYSCSQFVYQSYSATNRSNYTWRFDDLLDADPSSSSKLLYP